MCEPQELSRTVKVVAKLPLASVVVVVTDALSNEIVTVRLAEKPVPVTDTELPTCTDVVPKLIAETTANVLVKLPLELSTRTVYDPAGTTGILNESEIEPEAETVPLLIITNEVPKAKWSRKVVLAEKPVPVTDNSEPTGPLVGVRVIDCARAGLAGMAPRTIDKVIRKANIWNILLHCILEFISLVDVTI